MRDSSWGGDTVRKIGGWALMIGLLLACAAARGAHAEPADEEPMDAGPQLVHRVAPVWPASVPRFNGASSLVRLAILVDAKGAVADVRVKHGDSVFAASAVAAVRQWRFVPNELGGKAEPFWTTQDVRFAAEDATSSQAVGAIPLVRVPLVAPADGIDANGPPFVGVLRFQLGSDGFVQDVGFIGQAPRAAPAILARARHWVWEPARDASGAAIPSMVTVRVKSTLDALLIDRPDSTLGAILGAANYANVRTIDAAGKGAQRDMNPLQLAHVFADWISEDKAYAGPDPWRAHCPLRFDASIEFDGPGGKLHADFARACAWMQVTTRDRVLFVPYAPIRARIDGAFAKLFPDSSKAK